MATTVLMPRYGATMEEGIVTFWAIKEGGQISQGDLLGEIESEKLTNELLAEQAGVILRIMVEPGVAFKCGTPILIIGEAGELLSQTDDGNIIEDKGTSEEKEKSAWNNTAHMFAPHQKETPGITPKALQLAKELNIDYSNITGTGRFHLITREDIREYLNHQTPDRQNPEDQAVLQPTAVKMTPMQYSIKKTMEKSIQETIQTTISFDLDASNLVRIHQQLKSASRSNESHPTLTAIFVSIVAKALVAHPILRTIIREDNLITKNEINIGVVVDVPGGLIVPNIKHADKKNIYEINLELKELAQKARQNMLDPEDVSNGTFSISNLGMYGIKYFNPFLNPGETGILGIGALQEVPQLNKTGIIFTPTIFLNLTYDHQVLNGVPAAKFLNSIQMIANEFNIA